MGIKNVWNFRAFTLSIWTINYFLWYSRLVFNDICAFWCTFACSKTWKNISSSWTKLCMPTRTYMYALTLNCVYLTNDHLSKTNNRSQNSNSVQQLYKKKKKKKKKKKIWPERLLGGVFSDNTGIFFSYFSTITGCGWAFLMSTPQSMFLWRTGKNYPIIRYSSLTLVLLNPDMPCICKQCRSRSVCFWSQLSGSALFAFQYVNLHQ